MNLKKIIGLLFFTIAFCSFSQSNLTSSLNISPELKQSANAVVRLKDYKVTIESQQSMVIKSRSVVTILNEKGNRHTSTVVWYDNYRKIKKIEAKIYDESGEEIKKFKKKDFVDQSAVDGGTLYSDSRMMYLRYTPVSYPYTVEFTYELETENTLALPEWRPVTGYYVSTEENRYSITDLAGLDIRKKHKNFEDYDIEVFEKDNFIGYNLKNSKALKPESLSPSLYNIVPIAMLAANKFHYYGVDGKASNWVEFGDWMIESLLKGRQEVTAETKGIIKNLVQDVEDPLERAKLVHKFVQENTRYISVQVGIGGNQPIAAMEVDRVKYGDCKGLTNYTMALLDIAGVESYYTVVESGNEIVDFEEDFASLAQGDHIILGIPDDNDMIWVDCTSQKHPFGFIGDFTDNRNVLVVKKGQSEIVKTEEYINEQNYSLTKADISIDMLGNMTATSKSISKGVSYDNIFPLEDQKHKDIVEYYKEYWSDINNLDIVKYDFINDKDKVSFTENVELKAGEYASVVDNKIIFSPNVLDKNTYVPKRFRNRKFPLAIRRGYVSESDFTIEIPKGYIINELPATIDISNKFGEYKVQYEFQDNKLVYTRKLAINKGDYETSDYEGYRKFRRKVAKHDKSLIIFNKQ